MADEVNTAALPKLKVLVVLEIDCALDAIKIK